MKSWVVATSGTIASLNLPIWASKPLRPSKNTTSSPDSFLRFHELVEFLGLEVRPAAHDAAGIDLELARARRRTRSRRGP